MSATFYILGLFARFLAVKNYYKPICKPENLIFYKMKHLFSILVIFLAITSVPALASGGPTRPSYGEPEAQQQVAPPQAVASKAVAAPAQSTAQLPAAAEINAETLLTQEVIEEMGLSEKKAEKLKRKINRKLKKEKTREKLSNTIEAFKRQANATFEDVVTLSGAIVTVVGILSIIFDPIAGVVIAVLGLIVYLLGRQAGGSLNNIF